jgi:hypothetical protein
MDSSADEKGGSGTTPAPEARLAAVGLQWGWFNRVSAKQFWPSGLRPEQEDSINNSRFSDFSEGQLTATLLLPARPIASRSPAERCRHLLARKLL